MRDFSDDLKSLRARLAEAEQYLSIAALRPRAGELEQQASAPDLWDDPDRARQVTSELSKVKGDVDLYDDLPRRIATIQNPGGHPYEFYQRCGFTAEGETQTRFGPAVRMSR